jgi:hypothetical protein
MTTTCSAGFTDGFADSAAAAIADVLLDSNASATRLFAAERFLSRVFAPGLSKPRATGG